MTEFNSPKCIVCGSYYKPHYSGSIKVSDLIKYFTIQEIQTTCGVCLDKELAAIKLKEMKNDILS